MRFEENFPEHYFFRVSSEEHILSAPKNELRKAHHFLTIELKRSHILIQSVFYSIGKFWLLHTSNAHSSGFVRRFKMFFPPKFVVTRAKERDFISTLQSDSSLIACILGNRSAFLVKNFTGFLLTTRKKWENFGFWTGVVLPLSCKNITFLVNF